ncbi:MAG: hypothetical protein ONB51_07250 [candidate division KSB1 bacterium]|nr:hypothetical protein [candidate division KSB1 bacterium]MDZ7409022.1 hypothetical protein [candidate division KSB1 bacterium]
MSTNSSDRSSRLFAVRTPMIACAAPACYVAWATQAVPGGRNAPKRAGPSIKKISRTLILNDEQFIRVEWQHLLRNDPKVMFDGRSGKPDGGHVDFQ